MVEQGLDQATQEALIAHLRRRGPGGRPLFLMTRSCAILDLAAVGPDEAILFCPANHSPPIRVAPWPGAPGYEAVATCLASPAARARTEGVMRSEVRRAGRYLQFWKTVDSASERPCLVIDTCPEAQIATGKLTSYCHPSYPPPHGAARMLAPAHFEDPGCRRALTELREMGRHDNAGAVA